MPALGRVMRWVRWVMHCELVSLSCKGREFKISTCHMFMLTTERAAFEAAKEACADLGVDIGAEPSAEMAAIRAQVDDAIEQRGPPTPGDLVLLRFVLTR